MVRVYFAPGTAQVELSERVSPCRCEFLLRRISASMSTSCMLHSSTVSMSTLPTGLRAGRISSSFLSSSS